ncbi:MAG: 50S ribosomal protein L23 [Candidatus Beckwithbacteria bacterium]
MILKPIITEKSMKLAQAGQFTFAITKDTTKDQVKASLHQLFKVDVVKVRILRLARKTRRSAKSRATRQTQLRIKAIVTLKPGQMIEYFKLPEKKKTKKTK